MNSITANFKLTTLLLSAVLTFLLCISTSCRDLTDSGNITTHSANRKMELKLSYEEGLESPDLDSTRRKKNKPLPPKIDRIPW